MMKNIVDYFKGLSIVGKSVFCAIFIFISLIHYVNIWGLMFMIAASVDHALVNSGISSNLIGMIFVAIHIFLSFVISAYVFHIYLKTKKKYYFWIIYVAINILVFILDSYLIAPLSKF